MLSFIYAGVLIYKNCAICSVYCFIGGGEGRIIYLIDLFHVLLCKIEHIVSDMYRGQSRSGLQHCQCISLVILKNTKDEQKEGTLGSETNTFVISFTPSNQHKQAKENFQFTCSTH